MHMSNIVIMMIKFEMMTSSWIMNSKLLCWELDTKSNDQMEYDSRVLISALSVILFCQGFPSFFRKSLLSFTDGAFLWIKNDKRTSYKKAVDLLTIIRQIFINNHKSMILIHPPQFYYSDQGTPMD